MGKWTSEYYDDVLGAKIKSLVSGAVKRSKLEKSEPSISYEAFVEDLDPGDSFTTMLTELLVRRKGLRTLAAPQRVYRDRGVRGLASRRSLNLTDYLVVPPEEMELDDDNDSLESAVEGARINYDLYDAYTNPNRLMCPHLSPPPPHLRHVLRSTRRESWGTLRDASPDAWGPPPPATATAVPSAPPLTRQPSIRRVPARSRTVDFTDFTSRRRSSGREGNNNATAGDAEADESAAQTTTTSASTFPPLNAMGMPPRRFFPSRRPELPWSPLPESTGSSTSINSSPSITNTGTGTGTATGAGAMPSTRSSPAPVPVPAPAPTAAPATAAHSQQPTDTPRDQRTFLSWLPSSALLSLPPPPPTEPRSSPRATPRLRRGGVRPPESLLPRAHVTLLRTESPEPLSVEGGALPMAVGATSPASLDPRHGLSSPAPAD
ncbi:hypothetical protein BJY52DRAFT_1288907 [Lactarius psammicola]|nr:hypothetical protein BJY52DRAFT_1288907 [Lactarius psammicola]